MGQEIKKIETTYNTVAKEYAETFFQEHDKKPMDREILKRFTRDIGSKTPVWDFGCGPGQTTKYLTDLGMDICGMDLSPKVLEQAKKLYPDIHFQTGNMLKLTFENNAIAGVVAFYAIVHFTKEQVDAAFGEIFRVLQPGGIFLFTYHIGDDTIHIDEFLDKKVDVDFMYFNTDFIENTLTKNEFNIIETIEREPYPGVEVETRRAYVFAQKPLVR
ncbi:MAG: class I SAM-dependent methyltransferase [Desulfobacteraceae bacterium]|nr:class I SAM-dependent methyltransferase [Desulfobacteraceae bacterium]